MRGPPAIAGEEAPEEELPRLRAQPPEVPTADVHRDDAGALRDDLLDPQAVAQRIRRRHKESPDNEQDERDDIEAAPVRRGRVVEHELVAGRDLVEPPERDRR